MSFFTIIFFIYLFFSPPNFPSFNINKPELVFKDYYDIIFCRDK